VAKKRKKKKKKKMGRIERKVHGRSKTLLSTPATRGRGRRFMEVIRGKERASNWGGNYTS